MSTEMHPFIRRPVVIKARRLEEELHFDTDAGHVIGLPGEWLIQNADGTRVIMEHETFLEQFEPATPAGKEIYDG